MKKLTQNLKLCCSILIFSTKLLAQEPFSENGMHGFKQNENVIIPATFEYVTHFSEELACVKQNGKWGFINKTGKWIIEPVYLSAQPMKNGLAKVKGPNGIGLINSKGEIVIPLEFSFIEQSGNNFDIKKEDKIGQLKEGWKIIPPKYLGLESIGDNLIYAKKNSDNYDVYGKTGMLFENQTKNITYNSGYRDYVCILKQNEKLGVYSANQQDWIEQPVYSYIHFLPTSAYDCGIHDGASYYHKAQFALVLCKELGDQFYDISDFNYGIYNSLMDIKSLDGQSTFFSNINSYTLQANESENLYNLYTYTVNRDSFVGILNSDMSIIDPIYKSIEPFGSGEIRQLPNKFQYYNEDKELEIEADSIKTLRYIQDEFYNEWGEFSDYIIHIIPSILIIENDTTSFIYNIETNTAESPIFSSEANYSVEIQNTNYDGPMLFTIQYELNGLMGYKLVYEKDLSAINYSQFFYAPDEGKTFTTTPSNGKEVILDYAHPNKVICSADEIFHSSKWNFEIEIYDDWGDFLTLEQHYLFQYPFYILKENNKMGVLTTNNKVITPKYDTLYPYFADSTFIITELNGNYGAINIVTGQVVEPSYNELPEIVVTKYPNRFYTFFPNKSGLRFFGVDNNWYISSNNYFEPVQENDKWFIQMNSEDGDNSAPLFEPRFDYIQETDQYQLFVATSKGKKGLINAFGDTLLPFEYTSIYEGEYDITNENGDVKRTMSIYKKKKQGIFIEGKGVIAEAEYDYYDPWMDNFNARIIGWIAKTKNKFCLLDTLGNTILPPIYSGLEPVDIGNDFNYILLYYKKNGRGLFYKDSIIVPPLYDWVEPAQLYEDNPLGERAVEIYKDGKMGLYLSKTNSIIEPSVHHIEYNSHYELLNRANSMITAMEENTGVMSIYGEEIIPPIFEDITFRIEESTGDYPLAIGVKNNKFYARAYDLKNKEWMVKLNPNLLFDQILEFDALIFEKGKITKYDLKTGEMENTVDSEKCSITTNVGIVFKENGKIGIKDLGNNVILVPTFNTIEFNPEIGAFFGSIEGQNYYFEPSTSNLVKEEEW